MIQTTYNSQSSLPVCILPFTNTEIHMSGEVFPCCPAWNNNYSFGNFYKNTIEEIWNSEAAMNFRKRILDRDYTICKNRYFCNQNKQYFVKDVPESFKYRMMQTPRTIKVCHDNECNLACISCRSKIIVNSDERLRFLNDRIDTIFLPFVKDATCLVASGNGDPFASRHYRELISACSKKYPQMKFGFHTNGLLFNEVICKKLGILDKIEAVSISIDAASGETYSKIRKGGQFDTLIKNLGWLRTLKCNNQITDFEFLFVVQHYNYREIPLFVEFARQFNAKSKFVALRNWWDSAVEQSGFDKFAVSSISHPEHVELLKVLRNPILKSKDVNMGDLAYLIN